MSQDCIFCKIVDGELPSAKVYEDDYTMAFMDIGPVMKGHTLVVPKEHYDPITGTPDDILQKIIVTVKKVAQAQYDGFGVDGVNVTQANGTSAGQLIPHIHFHVIPRYSADEQPKNWIPGEYSSQEEVEEYADKIRNAIK